MFALQFAAEATDAASTFSVLPALIAIPVLTAVIIALLPPSRAAEIKLAALLGTAITGAF